MTESVVEGMRGELQPRAYVGETISHIPNHDPDLGFEPNVGFNECIPGVTVCYLPDMSETNTPSRPYSMRRQRTFCQSI